MSEHIDLLQKLITEAKKHGADAADAAMFENTSLSVEVRLGSVEQVERSESSGFGLRVFCGKQQAMVSSTDFSDDGMGRLVERAVSMAKAVPEDPYTALAPRDLIATDIPDLDLYDNKEPTVQELTDHALQAEDTARAVEGITNSEGADAGYSANHITLVTSEGFAHTYQSSSSSLSACVLAGTGTAMERDYAYSTARFASDLESAEAIGARAAELALKRLHPKKVPSASVSVIFDPRVAKSLLGSFSSAINGASVARGTTFLKDAVDTAVFGEHITIMDDPYRLRGLGSRPFDGEGVPGNTRALVENGILQGWLLDMRSANQLGLKTTGNAARGLSSPPSPSSSNLFLKPGELTPEQLIGEIDEGFYVTDLFGMGINILTGDYSQGAAGLWIEKGEIAYPVSEVTIASNLADMFKTLTPANDLAFHYATNSPTVRIDSMTVAGA